MPAKPWPRTHEQILRDTELSRDEFIKLLG
jgi:hypothetical protein